MRLRRRVSTLEVVCLVCFSILIRVHHTNSDFEKRFFGIRCLVIKCLCLHSNGNRYWISTLIYTFWILLLNPISAVILPYIVPDIQLSIHSNLCGAKCLQNVDLALFDLFTLYFETLCVMFCQLCVHAHM